MVVLLVAVMFMIFIAVDALHERRRQEQYAVEAELRHLRLEQEEPNWVAGYEVPEGLHYHKGHTWLHWVSPDEAYVGVDDFARRLLGKVSKIEPPPTGAYLRQGEAAVTVQRDGDEAELMSPVRGEVVGVNRLLKKEPSLLHEDSYGRGWLYKIKAPDLHKQLTNLLEGSLAARFVEDARDRLHLRLMLATGNVIQDGGSTVDDLAAHLDGEEWKQLVDEFLQLKGPQRS